MKRKMICLLIILCLLFSGGCGRLYEFLQNTGIEDSKENVIKENAKYNEDKEIIKEDKDKVKEDKAKVNEDEKEKEGMTAREESVFRSCGVSEEEIARMKKEGMDYKSQSFVDTAIIMLDYLEEKYSKTFEAVSGDIPNALSDDYYIIARACEGEHVGEKFKVYYLGDMGCTDGYISILKENELNEAFTKFICKEFGDITVFAEIYGEYGGEITLDTSGEELMKEVIIGFDMMFTAPELTNEVFSLRTSDIERYLNENGINSEGYIFCFYEDIETDLTIEEEQFLLSNYQDLYKWREYIATRDYGG